MKKLLYIIGITIATSSCEKVIDVPLNEADIQTIVEAKLTDVAYQSKIKLSRSGSMYSNEDFEKISGASVTVTDQTNTWIFVELPGEPGTYMDSTFIAQPSTTYNLSVIDGTETYTATSTTTEDVQFDSLDYIITVGGFGQEDTDTNYFTFFYFTDNGNEANWYRVIPYKNGVKSSSLYLTEDQLYNGYQFSQPFFADEFSAGDTCVAELLSMDESTYLFYLTLSNSQGGGPFSPTPGNPVSNIEGGAIGYFGVIMTAYDTITYP